jgi:hypothetical protein
MKRFVLSVLLIIPLLAIAQDEPKWGIHFSGFVKNDIFFDTRQVETLREGHFLLYPLNEKPDKDGKDINASPSFNMLSIQSRLHGDITAPDALGAKTSGVLEAEFFGTSNADINGFRLRHAYVKLNWKNTELLVGQTWHPMFVSNCYPDVVSFNTGVPFQPFSRNPQIRVTQKLGPMHLLAAVMSQRDFSSTGPAGASTTYLRNSAIPDMHLQLYYTKTDNDQKNEITAGIGAGYKFLKPRLVTDSSYKTSEKIGSFSSLAYFKLKLNNVTWKLEGAYGQNMYDLMMLGGYAIKYDTTAEDLLRDEKHYTTLDAFSVWTDLGITVKKFQFGIFGGYTQNLGSLHNIQSWTSASSYYSRGYDIHHIYRVSPRVVFTTGKFRTAIEGEYTAAAYGSKINSLGLTDGLKTVNNIRVLLAVYYFF